MKNRVKGSDIEMHVKVEQKQQLIIMHYQNPAEKNGQ
jgi:hypothetical protein